jgi:hypothetical protein
MVVVAGDCEKAAGAAIGNTASETTSAIHLRPSMIDAPFTVRGPVSGVEAPVYAFLA